MTTHNDESLKPCPFCGSQPTLLNNAISCDACLCDVGISRNQSKDQLIAAWNRRVQSVEQPQPAPMPDSRKAFEAWFVEWSMDDKPEWQPERNCYKDFATHCAYKAWQAALASRSEHVVPEGYVIVPKKATRAMLRPFYECPPEELELAWGALLIVARNDHHTSNTGE